MLAANFRPSIQDTNSWRFWIKKTNALLSLINHLPEIDRATLYAKDVYKFTYRFLINKRKDADLKHFNDRKSFTECLNDIKDVYKSIEEYNSENRRQVVIVFDDMITDMISDEKSYPVVTELVLRGRRLNIYLIFITQP